MKKFLFLLLMFMLIVSPVYADDGHFETLFEGNGMSSMWVKLQDGRVLLWKLGRSDNNRIFNPVTNTVQSVVKSKDGIEMHSGALLNDGKVLLFGSVNFDISRAVKDELYNLIKDDIVKNYAIEHKTLVSPEKAKEIIKQDRQKFYALTPAEMYERCYLHLNKNPDLKNRFIEYARLYEKATHAQIYNPNTNTFEYAGVTNVNKRYIPTIVALKNGNAIVYNDTHAEIYDYQTGLFHPIEYNKNIWYSEPILLDDGRVLFINSKECVFYNPNNESFVNSGYAIKGLNFVKLQNGIILYKPENYGLELKTFNPDTGKSSYAGELLIKRLWGKSILLKDGRVMVYDGINPDRSGFFMGDVPENRIEIFDPNSGKSKIIGRNKLNHYISDAILLDDGRVLFPMVGEVFVPKK